jgi:hypothetical protein
MKRIPEWQRYERLVARLIADQVETDLCVTANARIVGRITGISRQIDVLIEDRHDSDNTRRMIVDAKRRNRRIDVKDVEQFCGMMQDVGATHGYLVSPAGYTKAAEKRAQQLVSLRILPLDRLHDFDPSAWPPCMNSRCKHGRIFWDGYPELHLMVSPVTSLPEVSPERRSFVHFVGKCDRCGRFHVRCQTCGDLFSTPEDDDDDTGHQCHCGHPWFWLASIEEDEHGNPSAELHLCGPGLIRTVDRRSM